MGLGYCIQDRAVLSETTCSQRIPGDEANPVLLAIIQNVFAAAIDEIVSVLHGCHFEHFKGGFNLSDDDIAQASVADDSIILQRLDRSKLFLAWHFRIDAVQLPESDLLKPEPLPAFDSLLAQVVRTSIPVPLSRTGSPQPSLGRDEDAVIGVEREPNP